MRAFEAARAVGQIGGEEGTEGLARVLERRDRAPWSLVEALARLRAQHCFTSLVRLLKEGTWQSQAVEALGLGRDSAYKGRLR
jgi:HEAT repeat protein